jgi:hypothetical protein
MKLKRDVDSLGPSRLWLVHLVAFIVYLGCFLEDMAQDEMAFEASTTRHRGGIYGHSTEHEYYNHRRSFHRWSVLCPRKENQTI